MLANAKTTLKNLLLSSKKPPQLNKQDVAGAREYIDKYWEKLKRYHPKSDGVLLGLPKPYLVPAYEKGHEFDFNELYYWDSYFMVQGMLDEEDDHKDLVTGILENLISLEKQYKVIPNASRTYLMGRSQPPLLTSFIFDVYETYGKDSAWLKSQIECAKEEYQTVWMGIAKPNLRQVYKGLSRYYDINMLHDLAEAESGWDMTPRFNRHALNFLPVDLNSMLYKYETDFARTARILGDNKEARYWDAHALLRQKTMDTLMWSSSREFFYDYNYVKKRRGSTSSLAAYFTMWAGLATDDQAKELVRSLRRFENVGGLATTDPPLNRRVTGAGAFPGAVPTQWAYPNGWAPLHFIVVKGLQRYGYHDDAKRIAMKWLNTNLNWFNKNHIFLEKYNVVQPNKPPEKGAYPSQTGFGWTNAVFERFCREFIDR